MQIEKRIRIFWLKLMYVLTIAIAGGLGTVILISPGTMLWVFGVDCPRVISGLIGSIFLAFAFISILGLRNPIKFAPLLLIQLFYKSAWLCFVAFPLLIANKITADMIPVIAVFLVVVIGDLIAIPFRRLFENS